MNLSKALPPLAVLALSGLALTGCLGFRQVSDPTRFYVLSALPESPAKTSAPRGLPIGLGRIDMPAYLMDNRIAIRRGVHEVNYAEYQQWAERLDKGFQRVLAADLSSLLPSDRVLLSSWGREEVAAEVDVSVQRFEVDEQGQVLLEARWRIDSPGGVKTLHAGHSLITRTGPRLRADPDAAVGGLSQAVGELSRQIVAAIQSLSPALSGPRE